MFRGCWPNAACPPGLFRLASREGIVLAFETLELEILLACRCSISISTPSPLLTYHHAVQTYLARRFGKSSRPTYRKPHQLTPPRAGPSALLRCKPFDCCAQYAKPIQPPQMRPPIDTRPRLRHHQHRHLQADQVRRQVHSHPYPRYATRKKAGLFYRKGHRLRLYDHR